VTFAFFCCVNWSSIYVTSITNPANIAGTSQAFYGDEDGSLFFLWNTIVGFPLETARYFVIGSVFVIALLGGLMVTEVKF